MTKEKAKKCPLLSIPEGGLQITPDCLQEECEWYVPLEDSCVMHTVGMAVACLIRERSKR
ncbi:MAG: hypothetical protein WDA59_09150 [Methanofastidiosum sp.]|jgi:hypothetical protein